MGKRYCISCYCELVVPKTWLQCSKDNNQYQCRKCKAAYLRDWRKKNPGAYKELMYGFSQEEYDRLLIKQNGKCSICETSKPKGRHKVFQIDHDHKTGKVRGLLCWSCNVGLGNFKDDKGLVKKALNYLEDSCTQ